MSTDFELFPGKSLSGLFKDIYDNQQNKKQRISELIAEMKKVIRHAGDMATIGPIIKDLVDTSVKNDDALIKMAAIAQRIIGAQHKAEGDVGFLSDEEKEQLLREIEQTAKEVTDEQDYKVDELTNEVEELKKKVGK
jgi:cell division septum initiation protein DivIVA